MPREARLAGLVLCAACALGACVGFQDSAPEPEPVVRVEMAVKRALLDDGEVAAAPIRVSYEAGVLRLGGFVESAAERARAERIAARAAPGARIVNALEIWRPRGDSTATAATGENAPESRDGGAQGVP